MKNEKSEAHLKTHIKDLQKTSLNLELDDNFIVLPKEVDELRKKAGQLEKEIDVIHEKHGQWQQMQETCRKIK